MCSISSFFFVFIALKAVLSDVPDNLTCHSSSNRSMGGACAIHSDKCCISYKGDECRKELNKDKSNAAPQLQFYDGEESSDSLFFDPRAELLCVKGLRVPEGNALRGREIRGIYLQVDLIEDNELKPIFYSSNTIVFPGKVGSKNLKKGLYCADMPFFEARPLRKQMYFHVRMITLPPDTDAKPKFFLNKAQRPYVDVAEVLRASFMMKNCQEWRQYDENCTDEGSHTENILVRKPENNCNFWRLAFICVVVFTAGVVAGHVATIVRGQRRSKSNQRIQYCVGETCAPLNINLTTKVCEKDETEGRERKLVSKVSSVGDLIMGRKTERQSASEPPAVIDSEDLPLQQTKNS